MRCSRNMDVLGITDVYFYVPDVIHQTHSSTWSYILGGVYAKNVTCFLIQCSFGYGISSDEGVFWCYVVLRSKHAEGGLVCSDKV